MLWTVGLTLAGRYRLDAPLGAHSATAVWAGTYLPTGRRVAVRQLPPSPELTRAEQTRAIAEVRAACTVEHPSVVTVYDILEGVAEAPVLVTELLRGETLAQKLSHTPMLSLQETATLLVPVLSALGTAHARGVVHGQVTASSIFIGASAGALSIKVLDFGIAKWLAAGHPAPTSVRAGAPPVRSSEYAAPEQSLPVRTVDHRADIWSVGVILYECLSGLRPHEFVPLEGTDAAGVPIAAVPLGERVQGIPSGVAELIADALVSDPEHRAQNLIELFNVLNPLAEQRSPTFGWPGSERRITGLTQNLVVPSAPPAPPPPVAAAAVPVLPEVAAVRESQGWRLFAFGMSVVAAIELLSLIWLGGRLRRTEAQLVQLAKAGTVVAGPVQPAPLETAQAEALSLRTAPGGPLGAMLDDFEDRDANPLVAGFGAWEPFSIPAGRALPLKFVRGKDGNGSVEMSYLLEHIERSSDGRLAAGLRSVSTDKVINLARYSRMTFAHRHEPMNTPGLSCNTPSSLVVFVTCRPLAVDHTPQFELSIPAAEDWADASLELADLTEVGPITQATNLKACLGSVDSLGFRADVPDAATTDGCDSGTLRIDDVGFR